MLIACLGVLGVTIFEANSRLGEISIRKALGATVFHIIILLSQRNIKVILISTLIAAPILWITSNKWLESYPSRINFSAFFVLTPLIVILFVVSIISTVHTLKAALANPAEYLKES